MSLVVKSPRKKRKWTDTDPEKLARKNIQEQQRRIKPGECLKYIRTLLDAECISGALGAAIVQNLAELNVKYEIRSLNIPRTVLWERCEQQTLTADNDMLAVSDQYTMEKQVMVIISGQELVEATKNKTLHNQIEGIQAAYPKFSVTLLIFGLKSFCRGNSIVITRRDLEMTLTEVQVLYGCSHRLLETAADIAATIGQFSKAIAEIPFKKQLYDKYSDTNLFLSNDNKDCVKVVGTAGLSRLWQQHLTRLPMVTLETAEAIISKYPQPKLLFEAYDSSLEGPEMLADLKIRRAGGPLATERRIGTELSRKIHTLYTSLDPNEKL